MKNVEIEFSDKGVVESANTINFTINNDTAVNAANDPALKLTTVNNNGVGGVNSKKIAGKSTH